MAVTLEVLKSKDRDPGRMTLNPAFVELVSESGIYGQSRVDLASGTTLMVAGSAQEVAAKIWPSLEPASASSTDDAAGAGDGDESADSATGPKRPKASAKK